MDAMSITDHGSMYGVVDFYSECKDAGIKPIIGCEFYVAHGSRHDRTPNERTANHLVLIAKDNTGYRKPAAIGDPLPPGRLPLPAAN